MKVIAVLASAIFVLSSANAFADPIVSDDPHIDNPSVPGATPNSSDDGMGDHHTDSPGNGMPGGSDIDSPDYGSHGHDNGDIDDPSVPGDGDYGI